MRVLFQVHGRRGMGHLMRSTNIARALVQERPGIDVTFVSNRKVPRSMRDPALDYVASDSLADGWSAAIDRLRPDVTVYDTMPPRSPGADGSSRVFVMRRCKSPRQETLLSSEAVAGCRLILIPHSEEEFGRALPPGLRDRARFTGPIVRASTDAGRRRVAKRYGLRSGQPLLVSTTGGGGFGDDTERLLALVRRVHLDLPVEPEWRHIVVTGPRFEGRFGPLAGMTVVRSDPAIVDLFAQADLVIASAGYNTVAELRSLGVPSILAPGARTHDDQLERARRLERQGAARVIDAAQPSSAAVAIRRTIRDPDRHAALRARARADRPSPGNREAARAILSLVEA